MVPVGGDGAPLSGSGAPPPPVCGDGIISGGETCDPGNGADIPENLNGADCESLGNPAGVLRCEPGTCQYDTQMCGLPSMGGAGTGGGSAGTGG